jgi:hypothetical protein
VPGASQRDGGESGHFMGACPSKLPSSLLLPIFSGYCSAFRSFRGRSASAMIMAVPLQCATDRRYLRRRARRTERYLLPVKTVVDVDLLAVLRGVGWQVVF